MDAANRVRIVANVRRLVAIFASRSRSLVHFHKNTTRVQRIISAELLFNCNAKKNATPNMLLY